MPTYFQKYTILNNYSEDPFTQEGKKLFCYHSWRHKKSLAKSKSSSTWFREGVHVKEKWYSNE